jgi:hypothetical protein
MIIEVSSIELPDDPVHLHLRAFQDAGTEENAEAPKWVTAPYFPTKGRPVRFDVPMLDSRPPVIVLWVIQSEEVTPIKGVVPPWVTYNTRGTAVLDIRTGAKSLFDLTDPPDNYKTIAQMAFSVPQGVAVAGARMAQGISGTIMASVKAAQDDEMVPYQHRVFNSEHPAVVAATERIYLQRLRSNVGELPASYFVMLGYNNAPVAENVLGQMLQNAADMHGWSSAATLDALEIFREGKRALPEWPRLLDIVGEMLVLPATSNFYKGDHAGKREVDRFQSSTYGRLGQADCEDVALDCHYFAVSVQKYSAETGPFKDLAWLLQQYTFMMMTGVATSPKLQAVGSMDRGERPEDYICHVWTMAVPTALVEHWKRANKKRPPRYDKRLKVLILEGTNWTRALHQALPNYYNDASEQARHKYEQEARRAALPAPLAALGYPMEPIPTLQEPVRPSAQSRFYRYIVSAWIRPPPGTREPLDYTFIYRSKTGMAVSDFLAAPPDVFMRPNFTRRLSNTQIMQILASEAPMAPLEWKRPFQPLEAHGVKFDGREEYSGERRMQRPLLRPWLAFRLQHMNELTEDVARALDAYRREHGGSVVVVTYPVTAEFSVTEIRLGTPATELTAAEKAHLEEVMADSP